MVIFIKHVMPLLEDCDCACEQGTCKVKKQKQFNKAKVVFK